FLLTICIGSLLSVFKLSFLTGSTYHPFLFRYSIHCFLYSPSKLPFTIRVSKCGRLMVSVKYFSAISVDMGAAHLPPQQPFSTMTATTIFGSSTGAIKVKSE